MTQYLNDVSYVWWQWMGSMFWQVSLLIVIVTALDMIIRKWAWPQVRYALWALVFIKLIIPPTWQMPTSIFTWITPQVEEQITFNVDISEIEKRSSHIITPDEVIVEQATWQSYALLAWISGIIIFTLMLIRKMFQFRKLHQEDGREVIPEWFSELMIKTAAQLKLKKQPSVIYLKGAKSPAVYGVFQPVLLLPEGYIDKLSKEQAEHVLIHELYHIKRGDLLAHWICVSLQIVYWFNPLLIWTRRQMRYVCEICCDLSVAGMLREKTSAYRETLLKTARELFAENMEPSLGFLGIFEEPFRLVPRLKWLEKKTWENRKLKIAVTLFASLLIAACVMPMSKPSQKIETKPLDNLSSDQEASKKNDNKTIFLDFTNADVTHILRLISEVSGKNIILDPAIKVRKVTFKVDDITWDEALELLLKETGLAKMNFGESIIWITTKEKMKETGAVGEIEKEAGRSDIKSPKKSDIGTLLNLEFHDADITSVLSTISKAAVVNIIWDPAIKGRKVNMAFKDMPWEEALDIILKETGLEKRNVGENIIWITTSEKIKNEEAHLKGLNDGDEKKASQNSGNDPRMFSIDFDNVDIKLLIKFISEITGKNIIMGEDVKGKVTIMTPTKLNADEAYKLFESVLEINGYTSIPSGSAIKIVKVDKGKPSN